MRGALLGMTLGIMAIILGGHILQDIMVRHGALVGAGVAFM